jgi:HlyD family secretion protein
MTKQITLFITLIVLLSVLLTSCAQQKKEILPSQMASVSRGNLILSISADGNLDMPHEVRLKFGSPGTVSEIRVRKGDIVRAGTLLARLDNSVQLLSVRAAQYSLESAINNVLQSCCGPRFPTFYSLAVALMRFEQAQDDVSQARDLLLAKKNYQSASNLSLARYDLSAARDVYANPKLDTVQTQYTDLKEPILVYPELNQVTAALNAELLKLNAAIKLLEAGDYTSAQTALDNLLNSMYETHSLVKRNSHLPGAYTYPDTSTSLAISKQVLDALFDLQVMLEQEPLDRVKFSEKLRLAQHDLLTSNMILDENETIYRAGLNPQTLRAYNINIENAMINLDKAKQDLLKTEILAPFDGTVVDIPVKENDQLSSFDYASKTAVHLVDTKTIKMTGIIDEIDITKVKVGQDALLTVDALPGQKLNGHVTFVSPFGTLMTGVVNFPVEIYLDPHEGVELRGGLTATADIIIGQRNNVLMVPNRAVKGLAGDYWVDVVKDAASATTEKRTVKIGMQNKKSTEIVSGLREGEYVLIEPVK